MTKILYIKRDLSGEKQFQYQVNYKKGVGFCFGVKKTKNKENFGYTEWEVTNYK